MMCSKNKVILCAMYLQVVLVHSYLPEFNWTNLITNKCAVRYSQFDEVRSFLNCSSLKSLNPVCGKTLTVAYSEQWPYVFKDRSDGKIVGLLPGILDRILVQSCCLGCNNITFIPGKPNGSLKVDMVMPIVNSLEMKTYHDLPYLTLYPIEKVHFVGIVENTSVDILRRLFESLYQTWPLFVVALTMAVAAGAMIWIMDTWVNKEEFPRQFPRGLLEGFWWAFVSMTTVGYGDRTPHSFFGRFVAVLWILFGVSLFNMYTAAVTTILTDHTAVKSQNSLIGKKNLFLTNFIPSASFRFFTAPVGLLDTNVGHLAIFSAILKVFAKPRVYHNLSAVVEGIKNKDIRAFAAEHMATWPHDNLINHNIGILSSVAVEGVGLGLIADHKVHKVIQSFLDVNKDTMDMVVADVLSKLPEINPGLTKSVVKSTFTNISNEFWFTLVGTLAATVFLCIFGTILSYYKKKKVETKEVINETNKIIFMLQQHKRDIKHREGQQILFE